MREAWSDILIESFQQVMRQLAVVTPRLLAMLSTARNSSVRPTNIA